MIKINSKEFKPFHFEVAPVGRLDTATAPQMEAFFQQILASSPRSLRLDLAQVDYVSSMGLQVIMSTAKQMKKLGGVFLAMNPQAPVRKVLEIANALPAENIFASVEEADRYLDMIQQRALKL